MYEVCTEVHMTFWMVVMASVRYVVTMAQLLYEVRKYVQYVLSKKSLAHP